MALNEYIIPYYDICEDKMKKLASYPIEIESRTECAATQMYSAKLSNQPIFDSMSLTLLGYSGNGTISVSVPANERPTINEIISDLNSRLFSFTIDIDQVQSENVSPNVSPSSGVSPFVTQSQSLQQKHFSCVQLTEFPVTITASSAMGSITITEHVVKQG